MSRGATVRRPLNFAFVSLRAIFFDLDDTLLDDTMSLNHCALAAAQELAADRAPAPQLAAAYVEAAVNFWIALDSTTPKPEYGEIRPAMWRRALSKFGIRDDVLARRLARRFDELRVERVELFPETLPVLAQLHGKYRLGVITNGFAETHEAKIARLELGKFFDAVILAGELGTVKPDPAVFRHAMELLGVGPHESLMVGDRFDRDVAGAQTAGMRTVWIQMRGEMVPSGVRPPDAIIASIDQLPAALARLETAIP